MEDRPPRPIMRVNGREMMRIQGVYAYIINRTGQVGAIMGFHPMVVVVYEDAEDHEPIKGYLRVDRWIYPLARSFSPIYIWDSDKLLMPDPFSPLTEPIYVVIRIPFAMSRFQKDTLWNLLDINAHVCGKFSHLTPEEIKSKDKLFLLTQITPHDKYNLDTAELDISPPGTKELPSLHLHTMKHKLLALEQNTSRLSISFANTKETKAYAPERSREIDRTRSNSDVKLAKQGNNRSFIEQSSPLVPTDSADMLLNEPGGWKHLITLPPIRGNLMRLYILGPRDPQHIKVSTVMEWIPVTQITLSATSEVFKQQVRLRKEKEEHGIPPSFEGRRRRLLGGWGTAENLNSFGVAKKNEAKANGPYIDLTKIDPAYHLMFQRALTIQNLEAASEVFDYAIDKCKLELLSFAAGTSNFKHTSYESWLGPLIPRDLVVRYRKLSSTFVELMTISATVEGDLVYETHTNYLKRIHEECEHHYPKLRPRNPYLDPQYPYPREPTVYVTKM